MVSNTLWYHCHRLVRLAFLGYKASMQPLKLQPFLLSAVLGPFFAMLFFVLVRLSLLPESQQGIMFLKGVLLIPLMTCVFYITASLNGDKHNGVFELLQLSPIGVIKAKLAMLALAIIEVYFVSLFWCIIIALFGFDLNLVLLDYLHYAVLLLSSCITLACFGLLISVLILKVNDSLILVNSIFSVLMIFSGHIYHPEKGTILYYVINIFPLNHYVYFLEEGFAQKSMAQLMLIGLGKTILYISLAFISYGKFERKLST